MGRAKSEYAVTHRFIWKRSAQGCAAAVRWTVTGHRHRTPHGLSGGGAPIHAARARFLRAHEQVLEIVAAVMPGSRGAWPTVPAPRFDQALGALRRRVLRPACSRSPPAGASLRSGAGARPRPAGARRSPRTSLRAPSRPCLTCSAQARIGTGGHGAGRDRVALRREEREARVVDEAEGPRDGCQALVGIVLAQQQAVLGARVNIRYGSIAPRVMRSSTSTPR